MARERDPYDPRQVFDDRPDLFGPVEEEDERPEVDARDVARKILSRAQKRRLIAPVRVIGSPDFDPTLKTFAAGMVLPEGVISHFVPTGLRLFDGIHQRFVDALPAPKMLRVDDKDSYVAFRKARREPYLAETKKRVEAVKQVLGGHAETQALGLPAVDLTDDDFEMLAQVVREVAPLAKHGGEPIYLPTREFATKQVACWRDGAEVLCTMRVVGSDGKRLFATAGLQLKRAVSEVLSCALAERLDLEAVRLVGAPMSRVLSSTMLVNELREAGPFVREIGRPFVGILLPASDAKIAATMALLQRTQNGEKQAQEEVETLYQAQWEMVEDAKDRLLRAQREKAERLRRVS